MLELEVSLLEEFDFLVKFLGLELLCYVYSIRFINIYDFVKGFFRFWERFFERFGCLEMIDVVFCQKIENFFKLSVKDNMKFYELCDIFCEIEVVKEDE